MKKDRVSIIGKDIRLDYVSVRIAHRIDGVEYSEHNLLERYASWIDTGEYGITSPVESLLSRPGS